LRSPSRQNFFDDEPIESILYEHPSTEPSNASAFIETCPLIDEIEEAFESGNIAHALGKIQWLLCEELPVPVRACVKFAQFLGEMVPNIPKPSIPDAAIEYSGLPQQMIAFAERFEATELQSMAGTIAYRWHEACGEYAEARKVLAAMRHRAAKEGDRCLLAVLTNNYGYEYLLEGKHEEAIPHFAEALELFEEVRRKSDVVNARANILSCRFATMSVAEWETLLPELAETHRELHASGDWRVRKTMRLYAERAAARGRLAVAVGWASRAVDASRSMPTQLRQEDANYVTWLERRWRRRRTSNRRSRASPTVQSNLDEAGKITALSRNPSEKRPVNNALMGVETEYAFTPFRNDGSALNRADYSQRLVSLTARHYPSLYGRNRYDLFLGNGSRLYVDSGLGLLNIEYSTPECTNPEELIAHVRAGDRLLASLGRKLEQNEPLLDRAFISKCNFDYSGHTSGSHENYLHTSSQRQLASQLIPHLISRIIYTGGGGFDDSVPHVEYMLSPRVRFLEQVSSSGSQSDRAIFGTRQESLSNSHYGRLHLLCGEGVRYDISEYLRLGVTALLVKLVDSGVRLADGIEIKPLRAINIVARDIGCRKEVALINGDRATAIDLQRHYLRKVQAHVGRPYLPDWADLLCRRWQLTLDSLETDPMQLIGILDWPTKLDLYRAYAEHSGFDWQRLTHETDKSHRQIRAKLFEFDICFGDISDNGPFAALTKDSRRHYKLLTENAINDALRIPPQGTRAKLRGESIEKFSRSRPSKQCDWSYIHDEKNNKSLLFDDPFGTDAVKWS
jgi:proteasome accessory factor A